MLTKDDTEIKLLIYYCGIRDASCHGSSVCSLHPVPKERLCAVPRAQEGCRQGAVGGLALREEQRLSVELFPGGVRVVAAVPFGLQAWIHCQQMACPYWGHRGTQ